jgi:hypothetical protein
MDRKDIISQYETSGEIIYNATYSGDYKTNNREGRKLLKIYRMFEQNPEFAKECIEELLDSENVVVRIEAASYCLALQQDVKIAERILEEISSDHNYGIFRFNAEMTLKVWREKGELQMYQK